VNNSKDLINEMMMIRRNSFEIRNYLYDGAAKYN